MVTRSNINYKEHKKDVYAYALNKFGKKKADKFIKHYSEVYDEYGRSFINYKLALSLMSELYNCKKIGTRVYAFVGIGGSGKSTLAKNVLYFLDPTFNYSRLTTQIKPLIKIISKLPFKEAKAAFMDEPEDNIHPASKDGKILRKILGKNRQHGIFIAICATDLKDIPPYIFRKLHGIFFTPYLSKGMFLKDQPKRLSYLMQQIRFNYDKKGYKTFWELKKEKGAIYFDTIKATPLDDEEQQYLNAKKEDYLNDIKLFLKKEKSKKAKKEETDTRVPIIKKLREQNKTFKEISQIIGVSRVRVGQILRENAESKPLL